MNSCLSLVISAVWLLSMFFFELLLRPSCATCGCNLQESTQQRHDCNLFHPDTGGSPLATHLSSQQQFPLTEIFGLFLSPLLGELLSFVWLHDVLEEKEKNTEEMLNVTPQWKHATSPNVFRNWMLNVFANMSHLNDSTHHYDYYYHYYYYSCLSELYQPGTNFTEQ